MSVSAATPDYPVFVAKLSNPNDYSIFANGGWDGNWYVGYDTCWIKQLPPIPPGKYLRAYLGAKVGRAKLENPNLRPNERRPIAGELFIAVGSTPAWSTSAGHRLVETSEIPLDGDAVNPLDEVGESQWFWTEIPFSELNPSGPNFVALWSPSNALVNVASSPVLAAGLSDKEVDTWLVQNGKGTPPASPGSFDSKKALSYFQPAIALKLIPEGPAHPIRPRIVSWQNATPANLKPVITASVEGESIARVWVEYAIQIRRGDVVRGGWKRIGRPLWKAPWIFSLDQAQLPKGRVQLRIAATNVWEETAATTPITVEVSNVK